MELELKELLRNPKFLYSAAAVFSILFAVTCIDLYNAIDYNNSNVDISEIKINLNDADKLNYPFNAERSFDIVNPTIQHDISNLNSK